MSTRSPSGPQVDADRLAAADRFVEEEEGAVNRLRGVLGVLLTVALAGTSLWHLYAAFDIVSAPWMRGVHVALMLGLLFLTLPASRRFRDRIMPWDWPLALVTFGCIAYLLHDWDAISERATEPQTWDIVAGGLLILLVLEAVRRASGWVMPAVVSAFIAYAFAGPWLPAPWTHKGYDLDRLVGHMTMTMEGIFGTPIDVCATLIVLFTIYGAVLQYSGAGKFFIDFALAVMGRRKGAPGRAVVLGSFLLGGPSGSGVATTVTLGSVAYPLLERAGYSKESAGGLLAAGGLGAILSPPVLGAAAFLIAEFLKISYLDVIRMAAIPTVLYYLSLFVMVEIDARKFGGAVAAGAGLRASTLVRQHGYHFLSLVTVVVFLVIGFSPMTSVFWAIVIAVALSFVRRDTALVPKRLLGALAEGSRGVLGVAATCAAAGIIVGVVTLTGLGLKFSGIVIDYADGSRALTALYTALLVWIVGLAVPVTASYIICAVVAAPALIHVGIADYAAHMFIFYYAVLSEVSPPTALSPFAAAAITGGDPYRTTLSSWKYTLPAFVTPFMFVLAPEGVGLLLSGPAADIALVVVTAIGGIVALAIGAQGWLSHKLSLVERAAFIVAGLLLAWSASWSDTAGALLAVAAVVLHRWRTGPGSRRSSG
ncbi:MAG: TRAP transporter fused permease subunit [Betaproteobacteria bacterium]|nr:TRAP transporter fused permease subunit [Betaproteobacteria bacterium]